MTQPSLEQALQCLADLEAEGRMSEKAERARQFEAAFPGRRIFAVHGGLAYASFGDYVNASLAYLRALAAGPPNATFHALTLVAMSRTPLVQRNMLYETWLSLTLSDGSEDDVIAYLVGLFAEDPVCRDVMAVLAFLFVGFGRPDLALEAWGHCLEAPQARALAGDAVQTQYLGTSVNYDDAPNHYEWVNEFLVFAGGIVGDASGLVIVDAGCGSGLAAPQLRHWAASLTGIDLSADMLRHAEAKGLYDRLEQGDMVECLGRLDGTVDLVACLGSSYYLDDLTPLLRVVSGALKPGGLLLLQDYPAPEGSGVRQTTGDPPRFCRAPDLLRREAAAAGLRECACQVGIAFRLPSYYWAFRKGV